MNSASNSDLHSPPHLPLSKMRTSEILAMQVQQDEEQRKTEMRLLFRQTMGEIMEELHIPSLHGMAKTLEGMQETNSGVQKSLTATCEETTGTVTQSMERMEQSNRLSRKWLMALLASLLLIVICSGVVAWRAMQSGSMLPAAQTAEAATRLTQLRNEEEVLRGKVKKLSSDLTDLEMSREAQKAEIAARQMELQTTIRLIADMSVSQRQVSAQLESLQKLNQTFQFRLLPSAEGVYIRIPDAATPFKQDGVTYIQVQPAVK